MRIGVPREIKTEEYRVALTPAAVTELCNRGHQVFMETGAGAGAGCADDAYETAGAEILPDADAIFKQAHLIVKVKEPQPAEMERLTPSHTLFTFLHLAADRQLTAALQQSGATCIAYETITDDQGRLPLLTPMSRIAGRLAVQAGAAHLEKSRGGRGILLGGTIGVPPALVTIIGGGVVGSSACRIALGMGANVCIVDRSVNQLESLSQRFGSSLSTLYGSEDNIRDYVSESELVIGAVLAPGRSADRIISSAMVRRMRPRSVIVDVAIDQGGCCANSRPTTHAEPTFIVDDVIHYCVANMPGAVPTTASRALSHATLPFLIELADKGITQAMEYNRHLGQGLNIRDGRIVHPAVAESLQST